MWDYPRPPALERTDAHLRVELGGEVIAETRRAWRVLETSQPPAYYFPLEDVRTDLFVASHHITFCEWKGQATYRSVRVGEFGEGVVVGGAHRAIMPTPPNAAFW